MCTAASTLPCPNDVRHKRGYMRIKTYSWPWRKLTWTQEGYVDIQAYALTVKKNSFRHIKGVRCMCTTAFFSPCLNDVRHKQGYMLIKIYSWPQEKWRWATCWSKYTPDHKKSDVRHKRTMGTSKHMPHHDKKSFRHKKKGVRCALQHSSYPVQMTLDTNMATCKLMHSSHPGKSGVRHTKMGYMSIRTPC